MQQSIYDAIGGAAAVSAAVDRFYDKVWSDPDLSEFFVGVEPGRLKGHQRAFLALALGGPNVYRGRPLERAHRGRGIDHRAFDRVVEHLAATLAELSVPRDTIEAIAAHLEVIRGDVVDASARAVV